MNETKYVTQIYFALMIMIIQKDERLGNINNLLLRQ